MKYETPLELSSPNSSKIDASVIWLHGLGADGYDFAPIVQELNLPNIPFILPHAPARPVTMNNGYIMPAWYDLYGLTASGREDEAGIKISQEYLNSLIEIEINRDTPANRIVLAGFSQGGAIVLHTALRYPQKLAGIMALSTYLPLRNMREAELNPANTNTPIFMAHGIYDEVITLERSQISLKLLQNRQIPVSWHEYNMAHSVCPQEIDDIRCFLQQVLQ